MRREHKKKWNALNFMFFVRQERPSRVLWTLGSAKSGNLGWLRGLGRRTTECGIPAKPKLAEQTERPVRAPDDIVGSSGSGELAAQYKHGAGLPKKDTDHSKRRKPPPSSSIGTNGQATVCRGSVPAHVLMRVGCASELPADVEGLHLRHGPYAVPCSPWGWGYFSPLNMVITQKLCTTSWLMAPDSLT